MVMKDGETQEEVESRKAKMGWTVSELAMVVGVDTSRIRQLLIEGKQLSGKKFGKMWTISDTEAKRFIEQYKQDKLD